MPDIYVAPTEKVKQVAAGQSARRNPLSAFVARPNNFRFETQHTQEEIILLVRRHPITNFPWLLTALGMAFFPGLIFHFTLLEFIPSAYLLIIVLGWYLITFAFAFEKFLSWFFNVSIITEERVVDIDFPSILYSDISSTTIDKIEDVTVRVGGFVRSLFNYGDIWIQTAGSVPEIGFEAVPHPARVAEIINRLMVEEEHPERKVK